MLYLVQAIADGDNMGYGSRNKLLGGWLAAALAAVALAAWQEGSDEHATSTTPHLPTKAMYDAGAGVLVDGIAAATGSAGSGGMWAAMETPGVAAPASSGALVFCGAGGRVTKYPLPTPSSFPALPVVATDAAVWFAYAQGDGWYDDPSVAGPVLNHETEAVARLGPDGTIKHLDDLAGYTITATAAGSDGTVWFLAYTGSIDEPAPDLSLGHVWPSGYSTMRPLSGAIGGSGARLFVTESAVWITMPGLNGPSAVRIDPNTGAAATSGLPLPSAPSGPSRPTAGLASAPGPWVLTDNADHIVEYDAAGRAILSAGLGGQPASSVAPDGQGGFWTLVSRYPDPSMPASDAPSLTHLRADGDVSSYSTRVPSSKFQGTYESYVAVASDGVAWLSVGSTLYRVG